MRFAWAPIAGASGYHAELFRGRERIFVTDTTLPRVTIPATWDLGGRELRPEPDDRLSVWQLVPGGRAPEAIVEAKQIVDVP